LNSVLPLREMWDEALSIGQTQPWCGIRAFPFRKGSDKLRFLRVLLQRVSRAEVRVAGEVVGRIGPGLLVLLGVEKDDDDRVLTWYADKVADLRIFADEAGKMNRSVEDVGGSVLVVSQFTLAARTRKGRRPSYADAAAPAVAEPMCERFVDSLRSRGLVVETGRFGAMMEVDLINDGPVTIMLEPPS